MTKFCIWSSDPSESHGGKHDEHHEQDDGDEGAHHRPAHLLAEVAELLADGQPVCVRVAVVRQVDYGGRRRAGGGGQRQSHLQKVSTIEKFSTS